MAKVLGFTIEIQGQQKVIDTTNQLKEALKQIKDEMGKTSDAAEYDKLAKEAAKLTTELNEVNKKQREFNKESENSKYAAGSYNALNAELVKLRKSYKELSEEERNGPAGRDALTRIGQLDRQLKGIDASMGNFQRNVGNYPKEIMASISDIFPQVSGIVEAMGTLGSVGLSAINTVTSGTSASISEAASNVGSSLSELPGQMESVGDAAGKTGSMIAKSFAVVGAITAIGTALYQLNVGVSEAQADIRKSAGLSADEVNRLTDSLKNIDTRTSIEDLLAIGASLGQLGVEVNDKTIGAIDMLNVALGGELANSADEVTTKIGILRNLLDDTATADVADDYLRLGNALNVAGATGAATADVVQDIAVRFGGTARVLGLSSGEILGLAKSLQEAGLTAERAGSGLNRVLGELAKEPEKFAKVLKLNAEEFKKQTETNLAGAFVTVVKRVKEFQKSGGDALNILDSLKISGQSEQEVFLKLAKNIDDVTGNMSQMSNALKSTSSLSQENAVKQETLAGVWERLSNTIKNSFIGSGFIDVLKGVASILTGVVSGLQAAFSLFSSSEKAVSSTTSALIESQTAFNIEIETLKKGNLSRENQLTLINQINDRLRKDHIPTLIKEGDTLVELAEKQKLANDAYKQALILEAAKDQLIDVNKRQLDAKKAELDLAINVEKRKSELTQEQIKLNDKLIKSDNAYMQVEAKRNQVSFAEAAIKKNKEDQARLEKEYSATLDAAKKLGVDIEKALTPVKTVTPEVIIPETTATTYKKSQKQLAKEANDAIKKAEEDFQNEMLALTKQIEDARVQIVQESYNRELAAIEKSMSDKIDAYNKERDERLEINKETESKIIESQKAGNKEASQQLADFRKKVDDEDKAFTQRRYELDILLFEERNRLIADLDKKYADKAKAEREKAFNERLQQTNKYYDDEIKLSGAKSNEAIAILQNASTDEQEAVEDNEKAKIAIRRKYDNLIRAEQIKQLETELAAEQARKFAIEKAYEQSGVKLEGGAPTADAVAAIGNIEKQISALRAKGVKTNEKYNKEEVAADKKLMDEKVKNAVAAMQIIQDFASQVGSFIDELNQRQIARMEEQITAHQDKLGQLQEEMTNTTGAQRVELQRQIDNEKEALAASTQQKADAEKEAAKTRQKFAIIQTIINTAMAVMNSWANSKFPIAAAIAAGVAGAAQIGIIAAQAFADGGKVLSGEKIRNKPNIRMRNGDNVLATVRTGEVILNERQQARLGGAKTFRRIGVPGFASGGMVGDVLPRPTEDFLQNATQSIQTNNEIKALVKAMDARFDRLQVHVVGEDVANELNNQARAKKAAVI